MKEWTWTPLSPRQLDELRLPARVTYFVLLDERDDLVTINGVPLVGDPLMRGFDGLWFFQPVGNEGPQCATGRLARGGDVPQLSREEPPTYIAPLAERLDDVANLLAALPLPKHVGDFHLFERCSACRRYKWKRTFVKNSDEFRTDGGAWYVDFGVGETLARFLYPNGGLCANGDHC